MASAPSSKLVKRAILVLLVIGAICGLGPLAFSAWTGYRSVRAADWPVAIGDVREVELVSGGRPRGSVQSVRVLYGYQVAGKRYSGTTVAFGYSSSSDYATHAELYEKLKHARSVGVRYNPTDPADACLACGWHHSHQSLGLFGAIWIVWIGGFIWVVQLDSRGDARLLQNLVTYWKPSSPRPARG